MAGKSFGYAALSAQLQPINDELMTILQSGNWGQWVKTWASDHQYLKGCNILSGTVYKGSNTLVTGYWRSRRGYTNNIWATFNQLKSAGYYPKAEVSKGQFIDLFSPNIRTFEDKDTGEKKTRMTGVKSFKVINFTPDLIGESPTATMSALERVQEWERANKPSPFTRKNEPIKVADDLTNAYLHRENIQVDLGEPSYSPALDRIRMPLLDSFNSTVAYVSTLLHECAHSTGHSSRLDRLELAPFGSPAYAYEELIAELTAVYLCSYLGIDYDLRHHASYLGSWLKGLQGDVGYFLKAANAAQKAMEFILQGKVKAVETEEKELVTA